MDDNVRKMQWADKAGAAGPSNGYGGGGPAEESGNLTGTDGTASAGDGRAKGEQSQANNEQTFGEPITNDARQINQ